MLQKSENRQVTKFISLIFPIDCCVRINLTVYSVVILSHRYLDSGLYISKLLYSWLFIGPSEHHHTTQTSKFNNFLIEPPQCQTMSLKSLLIQRYVCQAGPRCDMLCDMLKISDMLSLIAICENLAKTASGSILHIAYSRYRAIPAIDIDVRDIFVGTLTSGPAASRAARHACMQCNRFIYLAEDSKHSMNV